MTPIRFSTALFIVPLVVAACDRQQGAGAGEPRTVETPLREPQARAPSSPAAGREEGMLFSTGFGEDGSSYVEAIARVAPGGVFTDPAPDSASGEGFYERWLNPGHTYTVLSGGRAVGTVTIVESDQDGCASLGANTRAELREKPWNSRGALATSLPGIASAQYHTAASAPERAAMVAMLRRETESHGGVWGDSAQVQVERITLPGGRFAVAGSSRLAPHPEDDAAPVFSAFKVAEPGADGELRAVTNWYHGPGDRRDDDFPRGRTLLDVADLDGDGTPELVASTAFSEAWSYTIYRRTANGWAEAYNGGGGGC